MNYRLGIFLIDSILFFFLLRLWWHWPQKKATKILSVIFFLTAPMIAKDFFYEGIDLAFVAPLAIAFILLSLYSQKTTLKRVIFWALFWLSFAIKFMSLPLIVPFFYLKSVSFKKELAALFLGFLIIWGVPLAIFRSSLSVSFVFYAHRTLKYASFPAYLVETVNRFTQTEVRIDQPPDFQMEGPISTKMTQIFNLIFPVSITLVILYALKQVIGKLDFKKWRLLFRQLFFLKALDLKKIDLYPFATKITLIFFLTIFLTGKIFSQPFHIWILPLLTIYPFKNVKQQLTFMLLVVWLLIIDTTPWIRINENNIFLAPLTWKFVTYFFRFLPMFILLFLSLRLPNRIQREKA
ncbi:hypothetical protein A2160_02940 [Candidatus Beckwithbacteria bacterium RBG_13_42_9]|uniref:Glycosyltransferase RgtA/B/C/D-like domain-containing protein n=1 Tax=Candidatus Beckwithbacteria bacterium RBG_13_42_9 TaxID=1797457 RepID=A0A1F5E7X8_9BACT|nr:MAG: hypothetical protein A2160_02940 [Candidatus Beckwithbacteria bacterium RBG_13_42_9]